MKNILITLVALLAVGCVDTTSKKPNPHRMELDNKSQYYDQNYRVYTLEGCEYIVVNYGNMQWGSHKGNCKNPIHYTK
jgi:hypothetical protein